MFEKTKNIQFTQEAIDELLDSAETLPVGALWDDAKVRLYIDDVTPTPSSVPGDFTTATFDGYADVTVSSWNGPAAIGTASRGLWANANFVAGAAIAGGENVYGYLVLDSGGTKLIGGEKFDQSIPIANEGDFISLDVILGLNPLQNVE